MIYIESESRDPYYNLALEEYVFEKMDPAKEYFMLWQNEHTIVVGKYQNTAEEINQAYVDEHQIKVARRLSGGGAVYHDKGNLNYTFIIGKDKNPEFDFKLLSAPVVKVLEQFDIHAEVSGRNDILIDGKKFCGNSQYTKRKRMLHHGCIMVDSNLDVVSNALKVKTAKFESKSVKSVQSRVTTINANAKAPISMENFKDALKACAFESNKLEQYFLTEEDAQAIEKLRNEKYATWTWNYGSNPNYNVIVEKKFASGLVTVKMDVEASVIKAIKIFGDFFGNGEIEDLEKQLTGIILDESLESQLKALNIGYYIHGLTAADLSRLLR